MNQQNRYGELGAGFNHAAGRYDRELNANPAMRYMRRISLNALEAAFQQGQRVLEIGCGTGQEAVHLARRGIQVLATDLSPQMVACTAQRAAQAGVQDRLQARPLAAGRLSELIEDWGRASFDGAYSSFGPLNGGSDLRAVSVPLAALVRPGGALVVSVMNRFYPLETVWYLLHGYPRQAVRRWTGKARVRVSPTLPDLVPTWYYTPRALARSFAPGFRCTSCRALPLLLPPPPLSHLWARAPGLVSRLIKCEERLAGRRLFCGLGDHFLMGLRRSEIDPGIA